MGTCKYCLSEIPDNAKKCVHCQSSLNFLGRLVNTWTPLLSVLIATISFFSAFISFEAKKETEIELSTTNKEKTALEKTVQSSKIEIKNKEIKLAAAEEAVEKVLRQRNLTPQTLKLSTNEKIQIENKMLTRKEMSIIDKDDQVKLILNKAARKISP